MGVWGTGIYSGDFAADLHSTIGAVSRLPFDANRLVEILCETEATAANDPEDEDHTIFWLVMSDQFIKRGIVCNHVRDKALAIIDTGRDLAMCKELGMTPSDLAKREKTLADLRAKLVAPAGDAKPRRTLKEPQPLLMELGDLLVYPTCRGECINPYFTDKQLGLWDWKPDRWGAALIIDCGRAFDFLAWYQALTIVDSLPQRPTIDILRSRLGWVMRNPGTCSKGHFKRMQLQRIDCLAIDSACVRQRFPGTTSGTDAAVKDISSSNELSIGPHRTDFFSVRIQSDGAVAKIAFPAIASLTEIMAREKH